MLVDTYALHGFVYNLIYNEPPNPEFGEYGWYYIILDEKRNVIIHESQIDSLVNIHLLFQFSLLMDSFDDDQVTRILRDNTKYFNDPLI